MKIIENFEKGKIIVDGIVFKVDKYGYLIDGFGSNLSNEKIDIWEKAIMEIDGISELTNEHRKVINFIQDSYKKNNGMILNARILCMNMKIPLKRMYELFPSGPNEGACRIARVSPLNTC